MYLCSNYKHSNSNSNFNHSHSHTLSAAIKTKKHSANKKSVRDPNKRPREDVEDNDETPEGGNSEDGSDNESGDEIERNFDGGDEDGDDVVENPAAAAHSETTNVVLLTEDKWDEEPCLPLGAQGLRRDRRESAENVEYVLPEFGGRHGGSRVNVTEGVPIVETAPQFFMLFITSVIIEAFVSATNSFGSYTLRRNRWKPINSDEFKEFLAIVLHMGVVKYPHRSFAWRKDLKYGNPWVRSLICEH